MKKLQINVFTNDLVWLSMIENIESFVHRTSWHEMPISELKVSKTAQGVNDLETGRILIVNNQLDKALVIEEKTTSLDDRFWVFSCISLKSILNYRICHPSDVAGFTSLRQSEVMTGIVSYNLVTQTRDTDRYFWNADKTVNLLSVVSGKVFGDIIDFTIDWETGYMGDTMVTVAKMFGAEATQPLGWNIIINDDYSGYMFDVFYGEHKHINQTLLPPVIFSDEFGNVKDATYTYSIKEWRNVAYLTWKQEIEGTPAEDIPISITKASFGTTFPVSFERKEMVINSNNKTEIEVYNEAYSELNKRPLVETFTAEILDTQNTMSTYNIDWHIGDIVTIQSKQIVNNGVVSIDAMITEIEEIYENGEYTINATFGEGKLSFIQLIKNAINQKK